MTESGEARLMTRAAFDLLNSISVTRDVVRWRRSPRALTGRFIDSLTGKAGQLDRLFDSHVADSLANLSELISVLRDSIAESDTVIIKALGKLAVVQERVSAQEKITGAMEEHLKSLQSKLRSDLSSIQARMDIMDAQLAVDRSLSWLADRSGAVDLSLADIWHMTDELWWGSFGTILRRQERDAAADAVRDYFQREFRRLIESRFNMSGPVPLGSLLGAIPLLPEHERESLELLTLDPDWTLRPLTRAVVCRSTTAGEPEREAQAVPVVTTVDRLGARFFEEARRGTSDNG